MGAFDIPNDTPNQIKTEGETISLSFLPGKPTSGQGTVQWNIPTPAVGCQAENGVGAYCGIVVVLSDKPITIEQAPIDGTIYESDPTANFDLHSGDRIGGALVVGAFYEGEKKSRGEDLTTSFIINDLERNRPYYVAGFAVDCQLRYHREGQRGYSAEFGTPENEGQPGTQTFIVGDSGILPTDGTGLVPGMLYQFEILYNNDFPQTTTAQRTLVTVDGTDVGTYELLVDKINAEINRQEAGVIESPVPLNQNRYYYDGSSIYQWDGYKNIPITILKETTDPSQISQGTYWFDTLNHQLYVFDTPNPGWNTVSEIHYHKDPTQLSGGGDYWFNGSQVYSWCSTTWCEENFYLTDVDPTTPPTPDCSVYWYNPDTATLQNWNNETNEWQTVYAVEWDTPPNNLTPNTYWYNETSKELFNWDGNTFITTSYTESESEPTTPANQLLWFNPSTEELKQWDATNSVWVDIPVLIWPEDPTNTTSCDLWWDTVNDKLYKWDTVHNQWDEVARFEQTTTDPFSPPVINNDDIWLNSSTHQMYRWDGASWVEVTWINFPTDPTQPTTGTAWHNTTDNTWFIWDTPQPQWNEINPIDSQFDPSIIPNGTLWFDNSSNVLYERQGTQWIVTPYSTTPFYPNDGDKWFDSTNKQLFVWERNIDRDPNNPLSIQGNWIPTTAGAQVKIDDNGNLTFYTKGTGSDSYVLVMTPEGTTYGTAEGLATGDAGYDVYMCTSEEPLNHGYETVVGEDTFLFKYLTPTTYITHHLHGSDAVHSLPTYEQLGVGDDGSPDERRDLITSIREQLGWPVVEVELTTSQINTAIDQAIEVLRQRTSLAYQRSAFFLDVTPGQQHYQLTDRTCGFHKVVTVMSAYRFTSAFLSSAHGAGVYGQIVLQHLYNMGTFDLLSYHLVSEYVEQLEQLFATRLTYHWNEDNRILSFYHAFAAPERILLDVTVERTEQEIMKDRWAKYWIERFALMRSMENLAQIRGKYGSLPGAGGGVTLNAADLMARAAEYREELNAEIDDFIVNDIEDIGQTATFTIG